MKKNRIPHFIGAKQLYMGHEMTMKQNAIRKKKKDMQIHLPPWMTQILCLFKLAISKF